MLGKRRDSASSQASVSSLQRAWSILLSAPPSVEPETSTPTDKPGPSAPSDPARESQEAPLSPSSSRQNTPPHFYQPPEPSSATERSAEEILAELIAAAPTNLTRNRGKSGPPHPKICPSCGSVLTPLHPVCGCGTNPWPSISRGRAKSARAEFAVFNLKSASVTAEPSPPDSEAVPVSTGLPSHNPQPSPPAPAPSALTGMGLASDLVGLPPSLIRAPDQAATDLWFPPSTQDAELSTANTTNDIESDDLAQPSSSTARSPVFGHGTDPSSSTNPTTLYSPQTPFTRRTSITSSASDDYKGFQCGCHVIGEGESRRQVYCPAHDPNLEESLQSALDNTTSPETGLGLATSSDEDQRPFPHGLPMQLPEGMRHPPVVSADPNTYLNNRFTEYISPPPGFSESVRGMHQGDQNSLTASDVPSQAPSCQAAPDSSPTRGRRLQNVISAQNSLDTQRSPPPNFREAMRDAPPPRYHRALDANIRIGDVDPEEYFREQRNRRIWGCEPIVGDWGDWCEDLPLGCRCCGAIVDNVQDTCGLM